MKPDFRTAEEIGKVLSQAGVRDVVVNACNSANAQVGTTGSNLAEALLSHSLECVLAMSFKVMDEAVEIFMNALYQSLLLKRLPFEDAARISRMALMRNSQRRARYMHVVNLLDYIVPVLYRKVPTSGAFPSADLISPKNSATTLSHLDSVLKSIGKILPSERAVRDKTSPNEQDLLGRDTDILQLEILMSVSRLILLHGHGGCGKTALLRYICRWWKASGWIQAYAYIDMSKEEYGVSLDVVLDDIGEQLNLGKGFQSGEGLVDKLQTGKYLLILDSLECLCTPILTDQTGNEALIQSLESFIKAVSNGRSMTILSSRQETTPLAPNLSGAHEIYHLDGLSILASADLLEQVAFEGRNFEREELRRRQNVDFLRRIVILLEGNPAAIRLAAPGLRKANGNAETLLNTLLYGVLETDQTAHEQFRFVRTVYGVIGAKSSIFKFEESLITPTLFGQFWTLMPMDLSFYFWFFYLRFSKYFQEGAFLNWISDEFRHCVKRAQMGRSLAKFWPDISRALIDTGILQPAVIQREDFSELPCYHVHPIFTIIMRGSLKGESQKYTKYAYVRQFVLWGRVDDSKVVPEMRSAKWNGVTQHEDHVYNVQAVALQYSVDDGDLDEEVRRMGRSLFDWVHLHVNMASILYTNQRQSQLFAPIYMKQLNRVLAMPSATTHLRSVPTSSTLAAVLSYSQILNCILKDRNLATRIVDIALKTVDTWKSASPPGAVLGPSQQFAWFQLRHAEAIDISRTEVYKAKELFERNLADDPGFLPQIFYDAIRRWQLQNLQMWLNCVTKIGILEGTLNLSDITTNARKIASEFKAGDITTYMSSSLQEHAGAVENIPLREVYAWAIDREKAAVAKFGRLTNRILDESMFANFADLPQLHNSVDGTDSISAILNSCPKDTSEWERQMGELEFGIRALGKDPTAAVTLGSRIQREAESSTTSTGWQNIGELHQQMFAAAVVHNENPDYKKGLTHLSEFLKTNQGLGVPRQDLVITYVNMATCYNGLKQRVETAKAVCKAVELIPNAEAMKCKEDANALPFVLFVYDKIAELDTLESFTKRRYMVSAPKGFKGLSFQERVRVLHSVQLGKFAKARLDREDAENVQEAERTQQIKDLVGPYIARLKASGTSERDCDEIERIMGEIL
jgi:CHAT domain/NB-ARC domain